MNNVNQDLHFQTATKVTTLSGLTVVVQANAYLLSKEPALIKYSENPALLKYCVVIYESEVVPVYMDEVELIAHIGIDTFSTQGK